ncbi:hypothetical protein PHYSODRAFT_325547 [Phytophthora sojae]|uniref:Uncharacterized protein n=1 Tax=Phytophthora sojae (strain P6497) TaxID=1094619 RepID=G4YW49_PHYSP|nr:hypothetical protein PHYSODRAFT_325547 [Phytophthora sojae]EGZ24431.1 hypothetical protein PHYSODRAFT_325547 [Phytophthora sojae]|eukprot:XP_009519719.1 hypothetical protein PHYSODRAFT_325547 [Phytophthora sojae]
MVRSLSSAQGDLGCLRLKRVLTLQLFAFLLQRLLLLVLMELQTRSLLLDGLDLPLAHDKVDISETIYGSIPKLTSEWVPSDQLGQVATML